MLCPANAAEIFCRTDDSAVEQHRQKSGAGTDGGGFCRCRFDIEQKCWFFRHISNGEYNAGVFTDL